MADLPVRGSVALAFRQDEINDVLKSLAVFDQSGGQEAALRNRVLAQLEATQNRLEEINKQHADLARERNHHRAGVNYPSLPQ